MSEFKIFIATMIGGGLFLLIASLPLDRIIGDHLLRVGLWLNAIDGPERDLIMEWRRTGRLLR